MMKKRWLIKESPDKEEIDFLKEKLNVSEVVAYLLLQRGITTEEEVRKFFRGTLKELHDPFLMKNMDLAVQRLQKALEQEENILIYGDYDVDGTTAVALMYNFLDKYTSKISYYIPDRYTEGYGVSQQGIEHAKKNNCSLIITLDCGIKAVENIALANSYGMDVIVCDHHQPGEELPKGIILDPQQEDCAYPYKGLSGCGVGFKFLQALCISMNWDIENLFQQLDLLAISIGADIVPVTGENRILARYGLDQLNQHTNLWIETILKKIKKEKPLTLTDVVFILAPRINAAGRLKHGNLIVQLLTSQEEDEIERLVDEVEELNQERRRIDREITEEALLQIEEDASLKEKFSTLIYDQSWHKGVVGIVASRLIEKYYRPTIVLTQGNEEGIWTGSARSVDAVNIYEVLENCQDLLEQFGGHFHAAGLSLKAENLEKFILRFEEEVKKRSREEDLIEEQIVERELSFNELFTLGESTREVPRLMRVLNQFEPFGPENMKPLFLAKNVFSTQVRVLKEEHLKIEVTQPEFGKSIDAIFFRGIEYLDIIQNNSPFDMIFTMEENQFRGRTSPQLVIRDVRSTL